MRSAFLALVLSTLTAVACSSHTNEPKKPNGSNTPVPGDAPPGVAAGPSERDCTDLFDHAVKLGLAETKPAKPEQAPTADEIAKMKTEVRDEFLTSCRAGTAARYRCAMAATTLAGLGSCSGHAE